MALTIGDNFSYQGAKPLDGRIKYDTLAAMKAMSDSTLYDGCLAYCVATDKTYQWKSTNTVDADTGRWREFETGGGSGSGHTIEDPEGTELTQRDTLQFGGDLEVSDDSTNEKTVVAPHELTAAELAEIMSTLPGQPTQGITIDLRGNEIVVGKVIESDGTEKTLYQKTINFGTLPNATSKSVAHGISGLNKLMSAKANWISGIYYGDLSLMSTEHGGAINFWIDATTLTIWTMGDYSTYSSYVTLQYTKTTS